MYLHPKKKNGGGARRKREDEVSTLKYRLRGLTKAMLFKVLDECKSDNFGVLLMNMFSQVLFSTETFAMGVNAPARTVSLTLMHSIY